MKTQNLKKLFFAVALILVVGVAVSGCMNRNVNETPNVVPSPSPDYMPQGSATNGATDNAAQSNAGSYDWTKNAAQIEAELRRNAETTATAFENQLDALYSAEAMDISTDIEVLDSILKSQNLAK